MEEHPELVAFAGEHDGSDPAVPEVRVVSVAFDDRPAAISRFFADHGGGWPVLPADTGRIVVDWGVVAVPESYLVAPSGYVAAKVIGGVVREDLDGILSRAVAAISGKSAGQ